MYNIPVISTEWNKQILITYTLIYLCKKGQKRNKVERSRHGQTFQAKAFLCRTDTIKEYTALRTTHGNGLPLTKIKGCCPSLALCNIRYPIGGLLFFLLLLLIFHLIVIKIEEKINSCTCGNSIKTAGQLVPPPVFSGISRQTF